MEEAPRRGVDELAFGGVGRVLAKGHWVLVGWLASVGPNVQVGYFEYPTLQA